MKLRQIVITEVDNGHIVAVHERGRMQQCHIAGTPAFLHEHLDLILDAQMESAPTESAPEPTTESMLAEALREIERCAMRAGHVHTVAINALAKVPGAKGE